MSVLGLPFLDAALGAGAAIAAIAVFVVALIRPERF